jgi:TPR repeat protein
MVLAAVLLLYRAASFAGEYEDGVAAHERGDYKTALVMLTEAANKGDARAQYMLGWIYNLGQGVAQDYEQAASWYRKAADQGLAAAQYNLGFMYYNGRGVTRDYNQALLWYRKAADQGNAGAQNNLGLMYARGQGVPQDDVEAHKWFNIAAAYSTDKEPRDRAIRNRDRVEKEMTPAQIAEAQKRAKEWKKK